MRVYTFVVANCDTGTGSITYEHLSDTKYQSKMWKNHQLYAFRAQRPQDRGERRKTRQLYVQINRILSICDRKYVGHQPVTIICC